MGLVLDAQGRRLGASDPLSAVDWQTLTARFTRSTAGDPPDQPADHPVHQHRHQPAIPLDWGGSQDNGTERRSTGGDQWFDVGNGDGGQVLVDPNTGGFTFGTFFGISPYRFSGTAPGFFSNQGITRGINLSDRAEFYIPWVMNQANPNQLFLGTYRLYRTNNAETPDAGDVVWSPISPDLTRGCPGAAPNGARGCFISAIGLADGGDAVYTGANDGYVYLSEDAVTSPSPTWQRVDQGNLPPRPVTQFAVDRSNYRTAYAAFAGFDAGSPGRNGQSSTTNAARPDERHGNPPDIRLTRSSSTRQPQHALRRHRRRRFATTDGYHLGLLATGMPVVSSWQISFDPPYLTSRPARTAAVRSPPPTRLPSRPLSCPSRIPGFRPARATSTTPSRYATSVTKRPG